jgi:hypothetical protein
MDLDRVNVYQNYCSFRIAFSTFKTEAAGLAKRVV